MACIYNGIVFFLQIICTLIKFIFVFFASGERGGLVVNASDSRSRGRGFKPHSGQTVLCP